MCALLIDNNLTFNSPPTPPVKKADSLKPYKKKDWQVGWYILITVTCGASLYVKYLYYVCRKQSILQLFNLKGAKCHHYVDLVLPEYEFNETPHLTRTPSRIDIDTRVHVSISDWFTVAFGCTLTVQMDLFGYNIVLECLRFLKRHRQRMRNALWFDRWRWRYRCAFRGVQVNWGRNTHGFLCEHAHMQGCIGCQ